MQKEQKENGKGDAADVVKGQKEEEGAVVKDHDSEAEQEAPMQVD